MDTRNYVTEIYKVEADKYSKTREIHWKVNISIWTVLIVAIYAKANGNLGLSELNNWIEFGLYLLYVFIHTVFVYKMHGSINRSLQRMVNMARYLVDNNTSVTKWEDFERKTIKTGNNWEILQVSVTVFLIIILYYIK